jgi:hypothetical protein
MSFSVIFSGIALYKSSSAYSVALGVSSSLRTGASSSAIGGIHSGAVAGSCKDPSASVGVGVLSSVGNHSSTVVCGIAVSTQLILSIGVSDFGIVGTTIIIYV